MDFYILIGTIGLEPILFNDLEPYNGFLHFNRDNRTSLTYDLIEDFRQQIVDKTVINLINKKQITVNDLDKRNNSIKLDKRKVIANKILDKINSSINYNGEELTYKDIINKQTSNLTKTVLDDEEFLGFSLHW